MGSPTGKLSFFPPSLFPKTYFYSQLRIRRQSNFQCFGARYSVLRDSNLKWKVRAFNSILFDPFTYYIQFSISAGHSPNLKNSKIYK